MYVVFKIMNKRFELPAYQQQLTRWFFELRFQIIDIYS